MEQFILYDKPIEQYRAYIHGAWHYFGSLPIPPWKSSRSYVWMDDKAVLKKHLMRAGVPVSRGGRAYTLGQARKIFDLLEKPVIVKPEMGSRGRHSLTHLYTYEEFIKAFKIAQQLCQFVVVEEHLVGSVYRGTYVDGHVWGSLRGDPPRITGDGEATIAALIDTKNQNRISDVAAFQITDVTVSFLARNKYDLDTVLEKGKTIDLTEKIGLSYGGDAIEDFARVHPKTLEYLKKAGDSLKAPIVGFDFIIEDITKDPDLQKWGIIEANAVPFINLHHFPREGAPINVAAKVWDMWDA
jgi:cyanophycin synthetase